MSENKDIQKILDQEKEKTKHIDFDKAVKQKEKSERTKAYMNDPHHRKKWDRCHAEGLAKRNTEGISKANTERWKNKKLKKSIHEKINLKKQTTEYKENQRKTHLTGYEYLIIKPNGERIIDVSGNQALAKINIGGAKGYYFFRNGAKGYKPKTGNWVGYEFYKK